MTRRDIEPRTFAWTDARSDATGVRPRTRRRWVEAGGFAYVAERLPEADRPTKGRVAVLSLKQ